MSNNKAFTMVELVFVIVVVGILSAIFVPRMQGDRLQEAADQVISHIRYTQHLAMVDDRFDPNDNEWYKERWQIMFTRQKVTEGDEKVYWGYLIFSDTSAGHSGKAELKEIAVNPLDRSKKLVGGSSTMVMGARYNDANVTNNMNLEKIYGVTDIKFDTSCSPGGTARRIAFDYLGRPMKGDISSLSRSYDTNHMITKPCLITLFAGRADNNITISVEPETGFAQIVP